MVTECPIHFNAQRHTILRQIAVTCFVLFSERASTICLNTINWLSYVMNCVFALLQRQNPKVVQKNSGFPVIQHQWYGVIFILCRRDKNKVFPVYTMKAYRGSIGVDPLIFNLCTRCRLAVN